VAAQLAHEPSSGHQGAKCARDRRVWIVLYPVQRGIGKDGVKFVLEGERSRVHHFRIQTAPSSGGDHVRGTVDAHHVRTQRYQFFRENSISATQIEDALASPRVQ
jgi:hypothetical protein